MQPLLLDDLSNCISHEKSEYVDKDHGHCHIPNDAEFTDATKTGWTTASSMYAWIAYTNIDHFVRVPLNSQAAG